MLHPADGAHETDVPIRIAHDHELLTIDVWDTLLRRRCHPDAVKLHVAHYLALNYWYELPEQSRNTWTLLRLRQQAEKEIGDASLSTGLDDEYRHLEVYARWLALAGLSPFPGGQDDMDALLTTLEQIELAQEKYVSYVDPNIAEQLSAHSARQVLFLSDFYLSATAIKELVAYHRIHHLVEEGVVSCDVGYNKRSGKLFRYLHDLLGVDPARHLHLGDNSHSDVRAARDHGITAIHYQPQEEHALREQREAGFQKREATLRQAMHDCEDRTELGRGGCAEAYLHGRKWSLLLVGFVLHVMECAVADRVAQLYFFTREGEFFLEIYRRLADADVFGFVVPPARLMHVSRLATFAGSLREFSTRELMRIWNQYSTQSLAALFKSLGMDPERLREAAERHALELAEPITYPWLDARVIAFFQDSEVLSEVERELAAKRRMLLGYLSSVGLSGQPAKAGIVDIGWRGTIQDNLAHALPDVTWNGYYLALNRFLNEQPGNSAKDAFGPDLNRSTEHASLLDFVAPLEMLCNSPNGSVIGYTQDASGVQAVRHADPDENRIHEEYVRDFQQGVLDSVAFWADFVRTHAYTAAEIKPVALELWDGIIQRPPSFLAQAYFRLRHNETFGMGGFLDKRERLSTLQVLMALVSGKARQRLQRYLNETGWLPGLFASTEAPAGFRLSVRFILWLRDKRNRLRRHSG